MAERHDAPSVRPPPGTLVPGSLLAHTYEIVRLINSGGMGQVYEAKNQVTGDTVALKVIRPELIGDERLQAMFVREAGVLRRIRDEAIVGYEGMFQDEQGRGFLVMSYIDGPSLAERMRRQPLSAPEAEALLARLASALDTAHRAGICHRDLSPDNVLLPGGELGRATLIDFGIAKLVDPGAGTLVGGDIAGKSGYMSPEQLGVVEAEVGPRSDIYSLALVIAAAVRGAPVEMGASWAEIVEARRRVPRLDGVPPPLRDRLARMLEPDAASRPASMAELAAELGPPPGDARPAPTPGRQAGRPRRRAGKSHPALLLAALAILLAAGAVGYLFLAPRPAPPPIASQPEEPVPPPPAVEQPAPPANPAASLLAQVGMLIDADFPCADLAPSIADSGILRLAGNVAREADQGRLQASLASLGGISGLDLAVGTRPDPVCLARALAERRMPLAAERVTFNRPERVYHDGESLVADISAAADRGAHVYLDFFDATGTVVHLRPNPLAEATWLEPGGTARHGVPAGEQRPEERSYIVTEPYGHNLLLLMASERPLLDARRPEVEPADDYLLALEALIAERPGAIRASTFDIETRP